MSAIVPREERVRANGLEHHVLFWGSDRQVPIVLAHGFLDHAWSWDPVAQQLAAAGRSAIAFSWRGHGETDWIGPGGYYHFADYILDLHELLPRIAPDGFHLVGHSMGGTACAMFAGTRPSGLRTLTLCEGLGPPAMPFEALADRLTAFVSSVARSRAAKSEPLRDLDDATRRIRAQHPALAPDLARMLAEKGTREVEGGRRWRFDPLHRTTSPIPFRPEGFQALLARIESPVLVVSATKGFQTADHAERLSSIPKARELLLEGVGHMMHWEASGDLAGAILEHAR